MLVLFPLFLSFLSFDLSLFSVLPRRTKLKVVHVCYFLFYCFFLFYYFCSFTQCLPQNIFQYLVNWKYYTRTEHFNSFRFLLSSVTTNKMNTFVFSHTLVSLITQLKQFSLHMNNRLAGDKVPNIYRPYL